MKTWELYEIKFPDFPLEHIVGHHIGLRIIFNQVHCFLERNENAAPGSVLRVGESRV